MQYEIKDAFKNAGEYFEKVELSAAVARIMKLAQFGNKYFNDSKVWEIIKTDEEKAESLIYNNIQIINALRILFYPIIPSSMDTLSKYLNLQEINYTVEDNQWRFKELKEVKLDKEIKPLFMKFEDSMVEEENSKLGNK